MGEYVDISDWKLEKKAKYNKLLNMKGNAMQVILHYLNNRERFVLHLIVMTDRFDVLRKLDVAKEKEKRYLNNLLDDVDNEGTGYTPLLLASKLGRNECVERLLQLGADANRSDVHGNTPLHLATIAGHHDVIFSLLDTAGLKSVVNRNGQTAIDIAEQRGEDELVRFFEAYKWKEDVNKEKEDKLEQKRRQQEVSQLRAGIHAPSSQVVPLVSPADLQRLQEQQQNISNSNRRHTNSSNIAANIGNHSIRSVSSYGNLNDTTENYDQDYDGVDYGLRKIGKEDDDDVVKSKSICGGTTCIIS